MKFNVQDRVILLNILPSEGSYINLKLVRKLRESLSFSEKEHEELNLKAEGSRVTWEKDVEKDVHIGDTMRELIIRALYQLDKAGKLTEAHIPVYEKFIGEGTIDV